jgi:predicted lipid-binding transport protein (Tim44 family)
MPNPSPIRTTFHRFLGGGALMLGALAAVLLVNGGWQAVAAALSVLGGLVFVFSFISLASASERPRPSRPAWAREAERTRAAPGDEAAPASATERALAAPRRPARGRLSSAPS